MMPRLQPSQQLLSSNGHDTNIDAFVHSFVPAFFCCGKILCEIATNPLIYAKELGEQGPVVNILGGTYNHIAAAKERPKQDTARGSERHTFVVPALAGSSGQKAASA